MQYFINFERCFPVVTAFNFDDIHFYILPEQNNLSLLPFISFLQIFTWFHKLIYWFSIFYIYPYHNGYDTVIIVFDFLFL